MHTQIFILEFLTCEKNTIKNDYIWFFICLRFVFHNLFLSFVEVVL